MSQPDLVQGRDIVITGQQPWYTGIGSNCKDIALEFAKHNRVLYVNAPLDRNTLWRNAESPEVAKRKAVADSGKDSVEQVGDNIWMLDTARVMESVNWISIPGIFEALNKRNNRHFAAGIAKAVTQLGFKDIILFNDNDIFRSYHLKEMLRPALSIYYSRDYMLAVDYWRKHGAKMEPELIAKSDVCVANSTYLANYCKQYNPRSYYVGQGCELEAFTAGIGAEIPADMADIKGPIVGYVGALQSIRLSIDIIAHMALTKPEWSIVLVGPEDEQFKSSALHDIPNVYFLGAKKPAEIPAYINAFDVCINPQLVNEVTIGNYPRKIDEYLAMGKPVLATATDAMSVFAEHCYLATTKEDYVRLAQKALTENSTELRDKRMAFAATHTWEASVGEIYKVINSVCAAPPKRKEADKLPEHLLILGMPRHDDDLESTSYMLAKELTAYFKVYYIDNPFTYRDYLRTKDTPKFEKRKRLFESGSDGILNTDVPRLKVVITPVVKSIHFLPEGALYRQALKLNEATIRNRILKVIESEGIKDYIFLNSFNFHYPRVAAGLHPALTVYQSLDPMIMDFDKKHGLASEPIIVKESDLVVCTAKSLSDGFKQINPETYFLPNAADITHSAKALDTTLPVHPYVSAVKKPIIGYFGNIERRMDYPLLEAVARLLPEFNFVFTGPYNESYIPASFRSLGNVHLTGKVPYSDMPSVIKGFDVAIIPFKKDDVSSSIFPLKLFEYLGAGKPVVSTTFNPDLKSFTGDLVRYSDEPEGFAAAIRGALNDNSEQSYARIKLASENTWKHRAGQLVELMNRTFEKKGRS